MTLFTIGATKKSAERFFSLLQNAGVTQLIDVRLNNVSQLAGFTKRDDLRYFAKDIGGIAYTHRPELAPTAVMRDVYRNAHREWEIYEREFLTLIKTRKIESLPRELFENACLLCSEESPNQCHRRLIAEYLREKWKDVEIKHLV